MKNLLAKICRPIFERIVFTRHLPSDLGGAPIYVSPRSDARVIRQDIAGMDPELLSAVRLLVHPGMNVWDIGSNLGIFSMAAAHLTGERGSVVAVDADAGHVELLRRTLRRAGVSIVTPIHCGIAAENGISRLNIVSRGKAKNFLAGADSAAQFDGVVEQHAVITVTLDWLAAHVAAPDVIKIDIEGAELMALRGAQSLMRGKRPAIYVEVHQNNIVEATALLRGSDYSLFQIDADGAKLAPITACAFNTVALPGEKVTEFLAAIA